MNRDEFRSEHSGNVEEFRVRDFTEFERSWTLRVAAFLLGVLCCSGVFLDAFQTIVLPRRPAGRWRITSLFYIATWTPWSAVGKRLKSKGGREQFFSIYGPLSLIMLLVVWAVMLTFGFAGFFYSMQTPFTDAMALGTELAHFRTDLYVSGTTLFTLGLGDVVPRSLLARALVIFEAGDGAGAGGAGDRVCSSALPGVLAARGGCGSAGCEGWVATDFGGVAEAAPVRWRGRGADRVAGEVWRDGRRRFSSRISRIRILCYYRSQHDNQSWLSALTAVLDTCALLIAVVQGPASRQAELTFAMSRHALIDMGHVFHLEKKEQVWTKLGGDVERLPPHGFDRLCDSLGDVGIRFCGDRDSVVRLNAIRGLYEPYARSIADYLQMALPGWVAEPNAKDQWVVIARLRAEAEAVLAGRAPVHVEALHALAGGIRMSIEGIGWNVVGQKVR